MRNAYMPRVENARMKGCRKIKRWEGDRKQRWKGRKKG
jgi:hypothetical protein